MASTNLSVIPSVLDYQTEPMYIINEEFLRDRSYSRTWWFQTQSTLSFSPTADSGWTKLAIYIDDASGTNAKMGMVSNVNTSGHNFSAYGVGSQTSNGTTNWETREWNVGRNYTFNANDYSSYSILTGTTIESNVPIFATITEAVGYVQGTVDISSALNFIPVPVEHDGIDFHIDNLWTHGVWTMYGHTEGGTVNYRSVRGRILEGGRIATYNIEGITDGALQKGVVVSANFEALEYTTDGVTWHETDTFPFQFFYRERINELGEFDYALTFATDKIPNFKDQNDATDFIQGNKPIQEADNWDKISPNYPTENDTADGDDDTTMGEVYTRSFFSQQYICGVDALQEISNAFYDVSQGGIIGIFDDIKKGLEMYGEDVAEAVQGCMFFPLDLTQVFTSLQNQSYIYFGGYKFDLTNGHTVNKIVYPNGYYDFGDFTLNFSFGGTWRDFAPYTRVYVFLAYIGWVELDSTRYMGKTVSIRYYIDTRTGGCLACLLVHTENGMVLYDYYNGQMGISMPITLTSYTDYANAQIQTLLTFGNGQAQNASNVMGMASSLAKEGVATGALATASVGLLGVGGAIGATKTLYGLTQNNINNFNKTKGGSTSMLNMFLPQECMFCIEVQQADETPNQRSLLGYPSNSSGSLNSFSGYLEVDTVNLVCANATDNEKKEIIAMLQNGVYI